MSATKLPLVNKPFLSEIWNDLCNSDKIVNNKEEFKDLKKELISYKIHKSDEVEYQNILYLAHYDQFNNEYLSFDNEYLSFGCSIDASRRINDHLSMYNTQKTRHLKKDDEVLKICNTFPKENKFKDKEKELEHNLKLFFKRHCCFQILEISKDRINKCVETHYNEKERKLYNQYWGFGNFKAKKPSEKKTMYIEYIEKPIEDLFLRENRLLRHTDVRKN